MATPNPPDIISEIRSQLKEQEALEAVAAAYSLPVLYSLKSLVCFGGLDEDVALTCPAPGFVLNFNNGDYLHIKREYTNDWLIGRIVGSDISLGFIPSEKLLLSVVERRTPFSEAENDNPVTNHLSLQMIVIFTIEYYNSSVSKGSNSPSNSVCRSFIKNLRID
jgi:hypothetical protein